MKVIKDVVRKDGKRYVTVQVADSEKLMAFKENSYYRLGGQVDDIVAGYVVTESDLTYWCSIEQKWI